MWWCKAQGGAPGRSDMISRMSRLGSRGKHKQNAERDLQTTIRIYGRSLGCQMEYCNVRLWDPRENEIYTEQLAASCHDRIMFVILCTCVHVSCHVGSVTGSFSGHPGPSYLVAGPRAL